MRLNLDDAVAGALAAETARRRLSFAAIGASDSGRNAADADGMLAEDFGRD